MTTVYKIGAARFLDRKIAEKVAGNKVVFAMTVNREGMTDAEREAAFKAFFATRES